MSEDIDFDRVDAEEKSLSRDIPEATSFLFRFLSNAQDSLKKQGLGLSQMQIDALCETFQSSLSQRDAHDLLTLLFHPAVEFDMECLGLLMKGLPRRFIETYTAPFKGKITGLQALLGIEHQVRLQEAGGVSSYAFTRTQKGIEVEMRTKSDETLIRVPVHGLWENPEEARKEEVTPAPVSTLRNQSLPPLALREGEVVGIAQDGLISSRAASGRYASISTDDMPTMDQIRGDL